MAKDGLEIQMPKPKGHIIYEGPSLINSKSIVVVATQQSNNLKTGNMIQTYILRGHGPDFGQ